MTARWEDTHGTYAGWNLHLQRKTPICDACRAAATAYVREWRRGRGTKAINFPKTVRPDLHALDGLGAVIAESIRWSA